MDVATWNINSLRLRLPRLLGWLERQRPDVVCLQETKCPDAAFPRAELEAAGYQVAFAGEKGLNGVAILSRQPLSDVRTVLPGRDDDPQRRFLSARVGELRLIDVYVPNGKAVASDDYFYKLDWLTRLLAHLRQDHDPDQPLVLLGDFNIAPGDLDVADPPAWKDRLHCSAHERRQLGFLEQWGLTDAFRALHPQERRFSWFDYRSAGALERNDGLRIDLILVSRGLLPRVREVRFDLEERGGEKPSDHVPVVLRLADQPLG